MLLLWSGASNQLSQAPRVCKSPLRTALSVRTPWHHSSDATGPRNQEFRPGSDCEALSARMPPAARPAPEQLPSLRAAGSGRGGERRERNGTQGCRGPAVRGKVLRERSVCVVQRVRVDVFPSLPSGFPVLSHVNSVKYSQGILVCFEPFAGS